MAYIEDTNLIEEIESLGVSVGGKDIFPDEAKQSVLRVIREQPTINQWISVEERLPENGRYIAYVKKEHHGVYKRDVFDLWYEDGDWYLDAHSVLFRGHVTHWMPLPEPPKEG